MKRLLWLLLLSFLANSAPAEESLKNWGIASITKTRSGADGDPINVGLYGSLEDVSSAFHQAGWRPADPRTVKKMLEILGSLVFSRPDPSAPVSNLYMWKRVQDLAFEKEVGPSVRERHHVRFWRTERLTKDGDPLWIGAATFDRGIWVRKFAHHIGPDVDAERNFLFEQLSATGRIKDEFKVMGRGPTKKAFNGEEDPYFTDGYVQIGTIEPAPLEAGKKP